MQKKTKRKLGLAIFLDPDGTADIGLLVIVERKIGVVYSTQCAGLLTDLREAEGFLMPLGSRPLEQKIYKWFWKNFKGNCYPSKYTKLWTVKRTKELKELIAEIPCWGVTRAGKHFLSYLKLDESRMDECVEAWIPVLTPCGRGILTLKNSD